MAPQILHRVIHGQAEPEPWQKDLVAIRPAILHGYRRHRVKGADYPGLLPARLSSAVLGTVVTGLTDGDMYRLDLFEGGEYQKRKVKVQLLRSPGSAANLMPGATGSPGALSSNDRGASEVIKSVLEDTANEELTDDHKSQETNNEIEAYTYIWMAGDDRLEDAEWDFESFKRDKMEWWVNADERDW
jgi:hypothetical protein